MAAEIIDGKKTAETMREELKQEVARLKKEGIVPGLGVILVGEDPASRSYVTAKERTCEDLGTAFWCNCLCPNTLMNPRFCWPSAPIKMSTASIPRISARW
jgi:methylenetetrahydrofolate dehydrogenase (NADP+)/methenyltetrahydrofolate cyclohydrolase